jgi:hypothetical protein
MAAGEKSFRIRKPRGHRERLDLDALKVGVRKHCAQLVFVAESENIFDRRRAEATLDDVVERFVEGVAIEGLPDVETKTTMV